MMCLYSHFFLRFVMLLEICVYFYMNSVVCISIFKVRMKVAQMGWENVILTKATELQSFTFKEVLVHTSI